MILLVCLGSSIPELAHAQGELRRMAISQVTQPSAGIPVFTDHPDKAAIIISSSLTNLVFTSNMEGIVDQRSDPSGGRYILIVEPFTQIINVAASGFMTGRFRIAAPQARDVLYFEIEPEERTPDLIPLIFNIEPADVQLFVDGQNVDANRTVQLPPGVKQVRLEREGYRIIEDVVTVSMDNVQFNYRMEEIDIVLVRVRANVPGASVMIDGSVRGQIDSSGGLDFFLYPGSYALSVSHSGYLPKSRTLQVREDGDNRVNLDLVRNVGTLSLQITPSDVTVQLNRQDYSGQARIELAPGRYRLEVEKQGYEPHSETLDIVLNEQSSRTISLQAHTGSLQFTVTPTNASVSLRDGSGRTVERWEGSRLMRGIRVGTYTLAVEVSGYQRGEQRITISKDQTLPVHVVLQPVVVEEKQVPAAAQPDDTERRGDEEAGDIRGIRGRVDADQGTQADPIRSAPFQLEWEGDINRSALVQPLPNYVSETEAVISIRFEVKPDGTVGRLQPIIKTNPALEREVLRTLRKWRFSRLPPNLSQESQFGTITFRFVLE